MRTLVFWMCMVASVIGIGFFGVSALQSGVYASCLIPIIVSPLAMYWLRALGEGWKPEGLFDLKTQSWAFVLGDTVALPIAFFGIAFAWRRHDLAKGFGGTKGWLFASLVLAVLIGLAWGILEHRGYTAAHAGDLLGSPTKLWHDDVVYPSLAFLLIYTGIPALAGDFSRGGLIALAGIVLWVALGVCDAQRRLDVHLLHPAVQNTILRK